MNILIVNKFLHPNGGSETYIFKLGDCLKGLGHNVEYFGMEHENRVVGNSSEAYTSNMDFHNASKLDKLVYPLKTIYSSEARKKIRLVLDDFKPDAVHINNFNFQLTPSIILEVRKWSRQTGRKVKILFTSHDFQLICPNHMMKNPITGEICERCVGGKFLSCTKNKCIHGSTAKSAIGTAEAYFWNLNGVYKEIDTFICCSHFMKTKLDTNPKFAGRTVPLHNFIDAPPKVDVVKKDYIVYFGRFSVEKGIDTLINVCKMLPDIKFIFAGTGPLEEDTKGIDNIENVGFKTGDELATLIREARLSIYPSQWYENCPFSVMESQMYGTPVIGANIGGIPELIQVGKTGELFESGNAQQLKDTILKLYSNPELLNSYTENCKDVSFDNAEQYVEKLMTYYK